MVQTLRSGWIDTGPKVVRFENQFKDYVDGQYAIALSSCTAALHLACIALGVGPGHEVITTPMTFCATVNAIIHAGGTPVLADIDPETRVVSPLAIREKITERTFSLPLSAKLGDDDVSYVIEVIQTLARKHANKLRAYTKSPARSHGKARES